MKVSSPDMLERLIGTLPSGKAQGVQGPSTGRDAFSLLLESLVKKGSGSDPLQADREKLAAVMELVQVMMSRSAMSAFMDEEDEPSMAGLGVMPSMPGMKTSEDGESKIRHINTTRDATAAPGNLDSIIDKASSTYGVDRDLIVSVIRAESGFDANATSPKGAMGLMQLMPGTARDLGVRDAYDPEQNVMAGTRYLKGLLDRYDGDVRQALAAYNWGMGNLERSSGGLPEETRNYIARIMRDYNRA